MLRKWVYEQAKKSEHLTDVVIATDDARIGDPRRNRSVLR